MVFFSAESVEIKIKRKKKFIPKSEQRKNPANQFLKKSYKISPRFLAAANSDRIQSM